MSQNRLTIPEALSHALGLHGDGMLAEAEGEYRKILAAEPDNAIALHLLGVIAHQAGKDCAAEELISKALSIKPDYPEAHNNLGLVYKKLARSDDAAASFEKSLAVAPDYAEAHNNLATMLLDRGQVDAAVEGFNKALALKADYAEAHNNLGLAMMALERPGDAVASYQKALSLIPNSPEVHNNMGAALRELGRRDLACAAFNKSLELNPHYVKAHNNLGATLQELGRLEEAEARYLKALALNPDYADALNNLGVVLKDLGRIGDAVEAFHKALAQAPKMADAHNNLGDALNQQGHHEKAAKSIRKALKIDPGFALAHSNLIFIQDLFSDLDQAAQQAERKRWDDAFIKPLADKIKPHANTCDDNRRLRIGYVSADFKHHSACLGFAPLILDHDRQGFDIVCYDGGVVPDSMTKTLQKAATSWRSTVGVSDIDLVEIIRADAIDILVDLSGHTKGARLTVFGHKPAPIQVTGVGHMPPGISTIDYRLTTAIATPPEEEYLIPEKPIYLETYFGFMAPAKIPIRQKSGPVTFGSLNRFSKITDEALALWARILNDVADSRLLIKALQMSEAPIRQQMVVFFKQRGITEDRLILRGATSHAKHLEAYNGVDIALDTFPQGGGITTLESLWMGTPVVGLMDPSKIIGRQIAFTCKPLGLDDWIAANVDDYHKIAVEWAARRQEIQVLGSEMRGRIEDVYGRFTKDVEAAYRTIWQRWCAG